MFDRITDKINYYNLFIMARPEGSKNKITQNIREKFQTLIEGQLDTLESDLKALKAIDRLRMILELSKFVIPTLKSTEQVIEQKDVPIFSFNDCLHELRTTGKSEELNIQFTKPTENGENNG